MYESEDEALKEIYRWNRSKVFQVFSNLDKLIEKYNQDTQGLDINEYIDYIFDKQMIRAEEDNILWEELGWVC